MKFDIWLLRVAVWILKERNVARCKEISRRDNNDLYAMAERVESILNRMRSKYRSIN